MLSQEGSLTGVDMRCGASRSCSDGASGSVDAEAARAQSISSNIELFRERLLQEANTDVRDSKVEILPCPVCSVPTEGCSAAAAGR